MMLLDNLSIIVRYSRIFSERQLKDYDLGFSEQLIIMYLAKYKDVNQESIVKYFMLDKGAVAKTCSKLDKKGLIVRKQNPKNKRENIMSLSEKGEGLISVMTDILNDWNSILFNGIGEEEIKTVENLAKIMACNAVKIINNEGEVK